MGKATSGHTSKKKSEIIQVCVFFGGVGVWVSFFILGLLGFFLFLFFGVGFFFRKLVSVISRCNLLILIHMAKFCGRNEKSGLFMSWVGGSLRRGFG